MENIMQALAIMGLLCTISAICEQNFRFTYFNLFLIVIVSINIALAF